jgi:uncharacterized membrane protein YphA (DoxX/SURF4 family)
VKNVKTAPDKLNRNSKRRKIIYRVTTVVIAAIFFITGVGNILPFPHIANDMARLGYPAYFLLVLGTWKVLASIALLIPGIPRIKEWAYAGMILDLTGAAVSRFAVGDDLIMIIIPLAIANLVTANYLLRHSFKTS